MKITLSCVLFLISFISLKLYAQDEYVLTQPFKFEKGLSTYVFADTAKVGLKLGLIGEIKDILKAGDEIRITDTSGVYTTLSGIKSQWYKISYVKSGEEKEGFIWGGLLSFSPHRRGDTKFAYGIEKAILTPDVHDQIKVIVKVIENGIIKSKAEYTVKNFESVNYPSATIQDNRGLKNVKYIFLCTFSGEACAIPTYNFYSLWDGNSLYSLPGLVSSSDVVDEGVIGVNQTYIFPKDIKGKPGKIILHTITSDFDKHNKIKETPSYKYYNWDGKSLKLIPSKRK